MKPLRLAYLIGVGLVLSIVVAACGGDDEVVREVIKEVPGETVVVEKTVIETVEVPGETVVVEVPGETVVVTQLVEKEVPEAVRGGTLRVSAQFADVPPTDVGGTGAYEAFRLVLYLLYDGMIRWGDADGLVPEVNVPGLATSWEVNPDDTSKWIFHLREGVKFHDGTAYNADAAIFSLDRVLDTDSEFYSSLQAALIAAHTSRLVKYSKIDDFTLELGWDEGQSHFIPLQTRFLLQASPAAVRRWGNDDYPNHPVGTGPFKFVNLIPRQLLELEPNVDYWGTKPKMDRYILIPMIEETTRLAALRTGGIDWIDNPPPDAIETLEREGFQVFMKLYPYVWAWYLNHNAPPFDTVAGRQAMNYAIDREGMCRDLLASTCIPATGMWWEEHPWFGDPKVRYNYDPDKARALLVEAGYELPIKSGTVYTPTVGGMMQPVPMNEYISRTFREVGVEFDVEGVDITAWYTRWINGFTGDTANSIAYSGAPAPTDALNAMTLFLSCGAAVPVGWNTSKYCDPELDAMLTEIEMAVDPATIDQLMAKAHEKVVEDGLFLFGVHDLNVRVLAPNVRGYVHPQGWFPDLTRVWVAPE